MDWFSGSFHDHPSRERIGTVDHSWMLPSLTSMMHQFFIVNIDEYLMFQQCLTHVVNVFSHWSQRSSIYQTSMIYLLNIDESSMKQGWITDEWIAKFTCSTASSIFIIPYQIEQNHWVEKQKSKNRTLNGKKLTDVFKIDSYAQRGTLWAIFLEKNYKVIYVFEHWVEIFGWWSQIWFLRIQEIILAEYFSDKSNSQIFFYIWSKFFGWFSPICIWLVQILVEISFSEKLWLRDFAQTLNKACSLAFSNRTSMCLGEQFGHYFYSKKVVTR